MSESFKDLLTSRKTFLGVIAIVGTQTLVALGMWKSLPREYVLALVGGLVVPITAIISAIGREDASKAAAPSVSPEHMAAAVTAATAAVHASLAPPKLISAIPPSSPLPQIEEPKETA